MRPVLPFALVLLGLLPAANAQQTPPAGVPAAKSAPAAASKAPEQPVPPPANLAVPEDLGLLILIRTALIALNQANASGNYTVLRDIGAPGFREANDAARLAEIFADLRKRKINLSPIAVVEPKLARAAFINEQGMLRITGFFPTRPEQVNFDLAFLPAAGEWRLFGISINTSREPVLAPPAN